MARWLLKDKHYLNVPGIEWEYNEVTAEGKSGRHRFSVPLYIDPADRSLQNRDGDVIVSYAKGAKPGDIIFTDAPSTEMEPLDEEAEALSAKLVGEHPIDSLPANFDAIPKSSPAPARRV